MLANETIQTVIHCKNPSNITEVAEIETEVKREVLSAKE
jgi:hypothetical protein